MRFCHGVWLFLLSAAVYAMAPNGVDACKLLDATRIQTVLGTGPLRTEAQEAFICTWVLASGEPVAQLLVTPSPPATFDAYRAEIETQMSGTSVEPVAGVGDYAAWTMANRLFAKSGNHGLQFVAYKNGTKEKSGTLLKDAAARVAKVP
jgi:hypothetical protein